MLTMVAFYKIPQLTTARISSMLMIQLPTSYERNITNDLITFLVRGRYSSGNEILSGNRVRQLPFYIIFLNVKVNM